MNEAKFKSLIKFKEPILGLRPANEKQRYFVMTCLIGWAQA